MILTVDIGNSAVKVGLWKGDSLIGKYLFETKSLIGNPAALAKGLRAIPSDGITHAAMCSVVPTLTPAMASAIGDLFGIEVMKVDGETEAALKIHYEDRTKLGADRVAAAIGAYSKYGGPCVVCDFGTATTIDLVEADGSFAGGIIAPGIGMMAELVAEKTAQLVRTEPRKPEKLLGDSTSSCIESGIYHSAVGLVEATVMRLKEKSDARLKVIATGGFASLVAEGTKAIDIVDDNLVLEGLRLALPSE